MNNIQIQFQKVVTFLTPYWNSLIVARVDAAEPILQKLIDDVAAELKNILHEKSVEVKAKYGKKD